MSEKLFKHRTNKLFQHHKLLLQKYIRTNRISAEWELSYQHTIYKKKRGKIKSDNYSGKVVASSMSPILW